MLLGLAKLMILCLPFKLISKILGVESGITTWVPLISLQEERRAAKVRYLMYRVSQYTLGTSNCYTQALASRILLGLLNVRYALYFGLSRDHQNQKIIAHAWIMAGKINVCGGESFNQFTVVRFFLSPKLASNK